MEDKSNEEDFDNATPRTSNKRVVSLEAPLVNTSASLPSIQEATLPLRTPLHNSDSEGSLFETHFQANEGGESDSRPVAPRRKSSSSSFQSDSDKIRSLEREMNFQEEQDGGASVSSSYVGDVDERADDIQFQPEGYLSVEPAVAPKPGSFVSSSYHTEATGVMSASGVTQSSTGSPERLASGKEINFSPGGSDIVGPNVPKKGSFVGNVAEHPLSESNIPGESFMKMGSLMQSELTESGEQGTGIEESGKKDDHDAILDDNLDENLIVTGEKEVAQADAEPQPPKDEHDDLLDSVLDDDVIDDTAAGQDLLIDHDDALLDSMLGDDEDDDDVAPANLGTTEEPGEYVPDESIRKLEALLDEGLAGHDPLADEVEEDVPYPAEVDHDDSMALQLDALLDGGPDEEVQFEDETPMPLSSTKETKTSASDSKKKVTPQSTAEKKKATGKVGRFFKSRSSPDKKHGKVAANETKKKKKSTPMFGSKTAQRASNSIRRSLASRPRKIPQQLAKSPSTPSKSSPLKGPKSSSTSFISMKRFMSPTFASRRRFAAADDSEGAVCSHEHVGSPKYSTPKSSWRSSGRSFMSSTLSSLKKLRSISPDTEEKRRRAERRQSGDVIKEDGTKVRVTGAFMEPTFAKTMLETETRMLEEQKALEREEEAKKIVVKLSWEENERPSPLIDYSKSPSAHYDNSPSKYPHSKLQTPSHVSGETSERKTRFIWTPKGMAPASKGKEAKQKEDVTTPMKHTPESVFSPRSLGSLSSMCSIHSFVSPKKAGIRGCQSKYNPTLHKFRAPCELCVFRLTDEEKDELDAHGRHFKVQFTKGGCPDCKAFPTSFEEPPVRLCMQCFAVSHRPEKKRMRKKGNDAAINGYSFAKTDYV